MKLKHECPLSYVGVMNANEVRRRSGKNKFVEKNNKDGFKSAEKTL